MRAVWVEKCKRNVTPYDAVRVALAAVLLLAAGLKGHQLATEPVLGTGILDSRWFLIAAVEFELFLGLWLLAGLVSRLTWLAALGCFGLFACVSLLKALSGETTCGCFGRVPVNPWYTAAFDFAIVLSLLRWRPHLLPSHSGRGTECEGILLPSPGTDRRLVGRVAGGEGFIPSGKGHGEGRFSASPLLPKAGKGEGSGRELSRFSFDANVPVRFSLRLFIIPFAAWLLLGLPAAYTMTSYTDTTLSDAGEIIGDGKVVVLEPEKWLGRQFSLSRYVEDVPESLKRGQTPLRKRLAHDEWLVVFYRHGCPKCREMLDDYRRYLEQGVRKTRRGISVAVIEIAPISQAPETNWYAPGMLRGEYRWFLKSPFAIHLRNGIVEECDTWEGQDESLISDIGDSGKGGRSL